MFTREYDRSLWLMLIANQSNSAMIMDFISSIPLELRIKINDALKQYEDYKMKNYSMLTSDYEEINFSGSVEMFNNISYWFSISGVDGTLLIGESVNNNGYNNNIFQISIVPNNHFEYKALECLESIPLGTVLYNFVEEYVDGRTYLIDAKEINYELTKTPFGAFVEYDMHNSFVKKGYKFAKLGNIPRHLNMFNMSSSRKLVRLKKYKNSKRDLS